MRHLSVRNIVEEVKRETKFSCAVAWASGSLSFAMTRDAEGAWAVFLCWVDIDKCDADRPNCRSHLVVRDVKKAMKGSDVISAVELFSVMPPLNITRNPFLDLEDKQFKQTI